MFCDSLCSDTIDTYADLDTFDDRMHVNELLMHINDAAVLHCFQSLETNNGDEYSSTKLLLFTQD